MKITKKQLKRIIQEEVQQMSKPEIHDEETKSTLRDLVRNVQDKFNVSEEAALEAISAMMLHLEK